MKPPEVDEIARDRALTRYALPLCLHIPIAARDEIAIERFIGRVDRVLAGGKSRGALLVHAYAFPEIDHRLPIWSRLGVEVLRKIEQVWVHIAFHGYRAAYRAAFPNEALAGKVLDHVVNRRVAKLKRFDYVRIVPISRATNSSSGGLPEKWGIAYHSSAHMIAVNAASRAHIQHADLGDIVKMMDVKTGGSLQDPVNEAQALVRPAC